jgi:hypothetical protein
MTAFEPSAQPGAVEIRLSEELALLVEQSRKERVRLGDVITFLKERSYTFLLLLLSLPFIQPIPIPGLSTPFGIVIALLGLGLFIGQKPWLPRALLDTHLPTSFLSSALNVMRRVIRGIEAMSRPRMSFFTHHPTMRRIEGFCILTSGLLLCLPLPIPFSNMLPALTVLCFAASTLGKDGYFYVAGVFMFGVTITFFGLLALGGASAFSWLYQWAGDRFFGD